MIETMTESMTEIPIAALPPAPAAPSARVTASGIVVAILPCALVAAFVMRFGTAPLRPMFAPHDIGGIVETAILLGTPILVTLVGIAIANRWRGWRSSAGAVGWLLVVVACGCVNDYFGSLDVDMFFGSTSDPSAMIAVAVPLTLLGIFLLVAKRGEPPPQPARPVTGVGVAVIVVGLAVLAGNVAIIIFAPNQAIGVAVPAVFGGLIALMGFGIARRGPGWRIYVGAVGWFLIVVAVPSAFAEFQSSHARLATRLCEVVTIIAMFAGLGWFVLWSKRREPRPGPPPIPQGQRM